MKYLPGDRRINAAKKDIAKDWKIDFQKGFGTTHKKLEKLAGRSSCPTWSHHCRLVRLRPHRPCWREHHNASSDAPLVSPWHGGTLATSAIVVRLSNTSRTPVRHRDTSTAYWALHLILHPTHCVDLASLAAADIWDRSRGSKCGVLLIVRTHCAWHHKSCATQSDRVLTGLVMRHGQSTLEHYPENPS